MMHNRYDTLFEDYLVRIALTKTQASKIDRELEDMSSLFLGEYDGDVDIYAQGSYSMGTTVKPLTAAQTGGNPGEYDIDIVLERGSWTDPSSSFKSICDGLGTDQRYDGLVSQKKKESCERVVYPIDPDTQVGFHVDLVPIKEISSNRNVAVRTKNIWTYSDTKAISEWFSDLVDDEPFLPALVLILKRVRDTAGLTVDIPSIIITALVCELYQDAGTYADDLINLVKNIRDKLNCDSSALEIKIPVINENLADKFDPATHKKIHGFFNKILGLLENGFTNENLEQLRSVLSNDFPSALNDYPFPELQSLRSREWSLALDGALEKTGISAISKEAHSHTKKRRWFKFYTKGEKIVFTAECEHDPNGVTVRWQVLNSPQSEDRRGNLFKAKKLGGSRSSSKFINEETEKYLGTHWIKYFVIDQRTHKVIALGKKWFVEVEADE